MHPKLTNFYNFKLRNLLNAHQETYAKFLHDNSNYAQKCNLKKKMLMYENQIKRILTEKKSNVGEKTVESKEYNSLSSYFIVNKAKSLKKRPCINKSIVVKNGPLTKYFSKKKSSSCLNFKNIPGFDLCKVVQSFDTKILSSQGKTKFEYEIDSNRNSVASTLDNDNDSVTSKNDDKNEDSQHVSTNCDSSQQEEKIEFFRKLGLITYDEYKEVVNRKNSRKRRTTANPQFSSAALEAKRLTKLEILEERKYRRKMALTKLNEVNSKKINQKINNENQVPVEKCSDDSTDKSKNAFKITNKQLYPGLFLVKKISNGKFYCKICLDVCQCSHDTVLVCKNCSTFFHVTCLVPENNVSMVNVKCSNCVPEDSEQDITTEQNILRKQLNKLRRQILSLSNANTFLINFCQKKEFQKSQLLSFNDVLNAKIDRIKTLLNVFSYDLHNSTNENTISDFGNVCHNSGIENCTITTTNQTTDSNNQTTYSDSSSNLMEQSSLEDFDLETSIYSHSNKIYKEDSSKCDNDIPVITFCA